MKCVCVCLWEEGGRLGSQGLVFLSSLKCSSVPFIDGREGSVCEWTRGEKHVFSYFCSHIKIRCREEEGEENESENNNRCQKEVVIFAQIKDFLIYFFQLLVT